jgi:hypothetical protein
VADKAVERWKDKPEDHDYSAASDYLSLLLSASTVEELVGDLRGAPLLYRKAKDLLRASALPLLPADDAEVAKDLRKVRQGDKLSPVLLVRGGLGERLPLTVADGYHRICASYHIDENADIPCRIADLREQQAKPHLG